MSARSERGMVLISSLLLLVIVTVLALAMFRSYGIQERIAGNVREKQRAIQSAVTAQQYAEWWLSSGNNANSAPVACSSTILDANLGQGQICTLGTGLATPADYGSWTGYVRFRPPNMNTTTAGNPSYYVDIPRFYITDMGTSAASQAEIYKVTAVGFGASQNSVAVVESTYSVSSGVRDLGAL